MSPSLLAIDLGTSGPKVALIDLGGQILATSTQSTKLFLSPGGVGEQCPNDWWAAVVRGCHEVLAHPRAKRENIRGVCCTAQWSGTVAIDSAGRPLRNALIWMDSRGSGAIKKLNQGWLNIEGYGAQKLLHWIYKTGGAPGHSGKDSLAHILYLKEQHPEVYEKTYKFLEPKDYLNFRLSGELASSYDAIALHWITDNRDLRRVHYDSGLLQQCGLDEGKFPRLLQSIDVLGPVLPAVAEELGLPQGVKVLVGSPDIQSAAVGSGAVQDFQAHLYIGSSSWLTCHVPFKKTDLFTKMATLPSALPGRYFVANEQESAGLCLEYLRQHFFTDAPDFPLLEEQAGQSPIGSRNLIFTPWLNGERTPVENHAVRGGFHNLSLLHRREDFVRAVYEGVALNSKWLMRSVERFIGRKFESIHFIGGGAQSALWCQIHADVLGCSVRQLAQPRHANARGAAWIAAIGLGLMGVEDIPSLVRFDRDFHPRSEHRSLYERQFNEFLAIYRSNRKIYERLNS